MLFTFDKYHRRSIRLRGYDYSQTGLYFVTICVQDMLCLFGKVENRGDHDDKYLKGDHEDNMKKGDHEGRPNGSDKASKIMILNDAGEMVKREWLKIPDRFPSVHLHEFVIMPNHFHCILEIGSNCNSDPVGATLVGAPDCINIPNNSISNDCGKGVIGGEGRATTRVARTGIDPSIGEIIAAFKSIVTVEYIRGVREYGWKVFNRRLWQRNYWEHIIRNYNSYQNINLYIINNPQNWQNDSLNN